LTTLNNGWEKGDWCLGGVFNAIISREKKKKGIEIIACRHPECRILLLCGKDEFNLYFNARKEIHLVQIY
jgi:hypothetical protein